MGIMPSKAVGAVGACNGQVEYCSRPWSQVAQIGTHDSPFIGPVPSANQDWSLTQQLDSGIRFLQAQSHWERDHLQMCHTNCLLFDGGSVVSYLSTVKTWMDKNPNEVVSAIL